MFKKGKSGNINGRPKGAKNKYGFDIKIMYSESLEEMKDDFKERFKNLSDRAFCELYLKTSEFLIAKPKEQENVVNELDLTNAFKQAINATY